MPHIPTSTVLPGYKAQSSDTSIDVDVLMFQLLRKLTPLQKFQRVSHFNKSLRHRCLEAIRSQHPQATPWEMCKEYMRRRGGDVPIFERDFLTLQEDIVIEDPIKFARKIADLLEPLTISYMVGGSVASSLLGENRFSEDLDLVIDIDVSQMQPLIQAFERKFYISEVAVEETFYSPEPTKSFNIVDFLSVEKADIFIAKSDPFSRSKMARHQLYPLPDESVPPIYISSAEDIVLQKLTWRQINRNESQKQWRDILGVLKTQGERLNFDYLWQWAETLDVLDDLDKAFTEAGLIAF